MGVGGRERLEQLEGEGRVAAGAREEAEEDREGALRDREVGEAEQAAEQGERRERRGV